MVMHTTKTIFIDDSKQNDSWRTKIERVGSTLWCTNNRFIGCNKAYDAIPNEVCFK